MALRGSSNEEKIWNYFSEKINNDFGVAGLMGNIFSESGFRPENLQNTYEKSLGYSDIEYTKAVDNGSYTNFINDKAGYGLAQWTWWSRKQNLLNFAKSRGKSIGDLEMQLDFLYKELNEGYKEVLNDLKKAKSVLEASNSVLLKFERPADQSVAVQNKRANFGMNSYNKFHKEVAVSAPSKVFYRVQVGAYNIERNAINMRERMKQEGFSDAFVVKIGDMYKVQIGAFEVKANAEKLLANVKSKGYSAFITEVRK